MPVTLNLFLALEFVFTFGIMMLFQLHPDGAPHWQRLMEPVGQYGPVITGHFSLKERKGSRFFGIPILKFKRRDAENNLDEK